MRCAFVGFDSAWAGRADGGICSATFDGDKLVGTVLPQSASFSAAATLVEEHRANTDYTLLAIDQPTMVPNATGMRAVERVAGSIKTGVQPANLGSAMFDRTAPIWRFLDGLMPNEDPDTAQDAENGLHAIEVFPGLALPALLARPCKLPVTFHYNPANQRKFSTEDWQSIALAAAEHAGARGLAELARWAIRQAENAHPTKTDQDCLDALLCLVVALKWRGRDPDTHTLGDWRGFMVTPLSDGGRQKVKTKAAKNNVPFDCGSWDVSTAALCYFGKRFDAFEWLSHPNPALGGDAPIKRAECAGGTQDVLDLIGRLEHGIPS